MVYGQQAQSGARRDTIVRTSTMEKPITGVAMMILYEEGKWKPTIPSAADPEFMT
jgi:CubicO group peptidase (beta-lactamase class C family)